MSGHIDRQTLSRVRAFLLEANAAMNAVPRPVPPRPPDHYDGLYLEVSALYRSYNRLPDPVQELIVRGYQTCLDALSQQTDVAHYAQRARLVLFAELMNNLHLSPEELVPDGSFSDGSFSSFGPDPRPRHLTLVTGDDSNGDSDGTEASDELDLTQVLVSEMQQTVDRHLGARRARELEELLAMLPETDDDPEALRTTVAAATAIEVDSHASQPAEIVRRRRWRPWAIATLAVAVGVGLWLWSHSGDRPSSPSAAAIDADSTTINRSVQAGDMAVIISHTKDVDDGTEVYVHVVNNGDRDQPAAVSLDGSADKSDEPATEVVPARSVQHRVLKMDRRESLRPVKVWLNDDNSALIPTGAP